MQTRVSCVLCFLLLAGASVAQNASQAPAKAGRSAVREQLINSASQRLQWEAAQTWSKPSLPHANIEPEHRPIHIDQPAPAAPKLRREWLQASSEAVTPEELENREQLSDERSSQFAARRQR